MTACRDRHTKARNSTPLLRGEASRDHQTGSSKCLENFYTTNKHQK